MCLNSTMQKEQVDIILLHKYFRCETSQSEELAIIHWLSNDPDGSHAKEYKDARALFEGLVLYSDGIRPVAGKSSVFKKTIFRVIKFAAAAAIIAAVWFVGRNALFNKLSNEVETIKVPAGKSMNMALADGTCIWLNSGTEIDIPVVFSNKVRKVRLKSGEVLFDVKKAASRPFVVDTYAGDITVLGTKFNVSVEEDRGYFSTALLEGSVKVNTKDNQRLEFVMSPNESLTKYNDVWSKETISNSESVICWTHGLVNIAGLSFEDILRKLEKTFDIEIVVDREDMPEIGLSRGKIRTSDGIEHALQVLAMASDFKYEIDADSTVVYIR